jgi:hypothetical protein
MANAKDEIGLGQWLIQERAEGGRVGRETDTKIDVRGDHSQEAAVFGCGRKLVCGTGGEGIAEKGEGFCGVGGVTDRVMLGGDRGHKAIKIKRAFVQVFKLFSGF